MHRSRIVLLLAAAGVLAWCGSPSEAQTSEEAAQVSFHVGAAAGIRRLRPETWGLVAVNVVNQGDRPAEVLATLYFVEDPNLQYARRLWVPARSKRHSWCPVLPPPSLPPKSSRGREVPGSAEVRSLLFDLSGAREAVVRRRSERVLESGPVPIHHCRVVTAVVSDRGAEEEADTTDEAVFEMVAAAKVAAGHSDIYVDLFEDFLPPVLESLDGLDQLVLASDRLALDPAALVAIRRWLIGGGHLWIMLDQVDPATVELLLGDAAKLRVVDRVGLTEVLFDDASPGANRLHAEGRQFEQPVDLVRVVAKDVQVARRVNGWPVSFWQDVGRGEVLFTTLGPRAWIRPRAAGDTESGRRLVASRYVATTQLLGLAGRFFQPRERPAVEPQGLEPYLAEQIGYSVAARESVAGVLGGFCLLLLGSGAWLARKKRLERMAWVVPLASASAAGVLVMMGGFARHTVPPTVAVAQLAEVDPLADDVHLTGLVALYKQEPSGGRLGARAGGIFSPDMTGLEGATRRMVRTDLDAWHWEHLVLPAGVRTAPFTYAASAERRVEARAAFGPRGLSGTLTCGPFEELADAVIALPPRGCLAPRLDDEGGFRAGTGDVLAPGQFVTGALLTDEQRRRQKVYEQTLSPAVRGKYTDRPRLFAWAPPLDAHFRFPEDVRQVGSALVAVPLEIERTPPGVEVFLPSPFLDFRSVGLLERKPSAAFSNSVREWLELRIPSTVCLRFQIPREVLPIALKRASLTVRVNAPSRKMDVLGFRGHQPVTVATRTGPVGSFNFHVTESELLELDERGGLLLGIGIDREAAAGREREPVFATGSAWKIEAVELDVAGTTLPPSE
jgi:hypothetical protein